MVSRFQGQKRLNKVEEKGHTRVKNNNFFQIFQSFSTFFGCGFFAYSWKLPAYSGAVLLTVDNFSFFAYSWSFLAYSGKVRLIRALRDCKQRSSTASKKAPTVSKKASPFFNLS